MITKKKNSIDLKKSLFLVICNQGPGVVAQQIIFVEEANLVYLKKTQTFTLSSKSMFTMYFNINQNHLIHHFIGNFWHIMNEIASQLKNYLRFFIKQVIHRIVHA